MSNITENCMITHDPLSVDWAMKLVEHPNSGAINLFVGTVREMTKDKKTLYLHYEAYTDMALKKLRQVRDELMAQYPGSRCAIAHRLGTLQIGEVAVVIAVSTPHRDDAFAASRYAIERIKKIVPIWKKEHWADGTLWVGDQRETTAYPQGVPPSTEQE